MNATVRVLMVLAQLVGTAGGALVAETLGLRAAGFLGPLFAMLGAIALYRSPVRRVVRADDTAA